MSRRNAIAIALMALVFGGCSDDRPAPKPAASKPARSRPAATGAATNTRVTKPKPPTTATASARRKVFKVESAKGFIDAVGSDRVIRLAPGRYDLTDLKQRYHKHVLWQKAYDGWEVVIRNVQNLRIEGAGEDKTHLLTAAQYAYVLGLENVAGVELVGLKLGHAPKKGFCEGGVIRVLGSKDVAIRNCVLYGCGREGLTAEKTERLTVERSAITDCTYGIMTVKGCSRVTFKESAFTDNREYYGIVISDSIGVKFRDCRMERNLVNGLGETGRALFDVASSTDVEVIGGAIRRNRFVFLARPRDAVKFDGVTIADNRPQYSED